MVQRHRSPFASSLSAHRAFTLVELIIVIAIIGILSSIGVQSYVGYLETARDVRRIDDLSTVSKFLEEYAKINAKYPSPDAPTFITWAGSEMWRQGSVGDGLALLLKLSSKPKDPIYRNTEYGYSVTSNGKSYELSAVYESDSSKLAMLSETEGRISPFVPDTFASSAKYPAVAMVRGTFNHLMTSGLESSGNTVIVAVPSITLADVSITDLSLPTFQTGAFVVHKLSNLPATYGKNPLMMSGSFFFAPSQVGSYSGSVSQTWAFEVMERVKQAYSGSALTSLSNTEITIWNTVVTVWSGSQTQREIGESVLANLSFWNSSTVTVPAANSCASQPIYSNATFTAGTPTQANQAWQQTNSGNPCYYSCTWGYKGVACSDHDGACGTTQGQTLANSSTITGAGACNLVYGGISWLTSVASWWNWWCSGTGSTGVSATCSACSTGYMWNGSLCVALTPLIPTMTNNTSPSGTASASAEYDSSRFGAFRAMNWAPSWEDSWLTPGGQSTGWLQYQFSGTKTVKSYDVWFLNHNGGCYAPKDWTLKASNNGSSWTTLDTQSNVSFTNGETKTFTLSNSSAYSYYRLDITASSSTYGTAYMTVSVFQVNGY